MQGSEIFDVIVLGSGAAGMSAALVAATEGLKVCLLEKEDQIGGTTAWSGGMVWAPGSRLARDSGHDEDSPEAVREYLSGLVPGSETDPRMAAFLEAAPEAVDYLAQRTHVRLRPVPFYPDYYPERPGASESGRVLEPDPFDASALGGKLKWLRLPLPEFAILKDMMVARPELPHFRNVYRSFGSFAVVAGLASRYALQKLRHGRGTSLVLGNALAARFLASLLETGATIRTGTVTRSLITGEGGRVSGVQLADGERLMSRFGLVLATGGFTHDPARRRECLPLPLPDNSATAPGATGDGARLADALGGWFTYGATGNAFWAPVSRYTRADGTVATYPHTVSDRTKPGLIAVNQSGERFVNEAISYHEFGLALLANHNDRGEAEAAVWLICDAKFLWRYGLGAVKPMTLNRRFFTSQAYLIEAPSISALEEKLNLPAGALARTTETYNRFAGSGEDPMFGRGSNAYQRFLGDAVVKPNPCVAPIERPPFFAVRVEAGDLGAAAGLDTDSSARVLDRRGRPVPGLYACGADMRSVMEGAYPGPGITLGPALAFGYLAAKDMVAQARGAAGET